MPEAYCKSRGLTRAFSQILRFNFKEAIFLNTYSIKIFLFFLVQLLFRITINAVIKLSNFNLVRNFDVVFSFAYFIFSFYNLILI
ncbi:hypothetical protein AR687_19715 [Flavobacteriaceae bacterium CRH]|nr:hypothetical protein AR687_19715 [Flavobacteriaceae bacterium CRH]